MVAKLADILARIPAIDAEVSRINGSAPPGVSERLRTVEREARNADGFAPSGSFSFTGLLSLAADLKLPKFEFEADGDRYQYSWPPSQPSLAAGLLVPGGLGPDWHAATEERDRRRREESQRLSAYYEERERELAKRREAELREAREAHRRKHG